MTYQLIIRPEAELDIEDAFEWYSAKRENLGSEFVRAVDTAFSKIGQNPFAYPIVQRQARRIILQRFPYSLVYVINEDLNIISIVSCLHGKQDPKSWIDRL